MSNMIEVKTAELEGAALDWAVAKSQDNVFYNTDGEFGMRTGWLVNICPADYPDKAWYPLKDVSPSTNWAQGGPLVERYCIYIDHSATHGMVDALIEGRVIASGPTYLIAAMRAIVASELGDTVNVPEELVS